MAHLVSVSLALYAYVKKDRCVSTSTPIVHHFVSFLESSLLSAHATYRLAFPTKLEQLLPRCVFVFGSAADR